MFKHRFIINFPLCAFQVCAYKANPMLRIMRQRYRVHTVGTSHEDVWTNYHQNAQTINQTQTNVWPSAVSVRKYLGCVFLTASEGCCCPSVTMRHGGSTTIVQQHVTITYMVFDRNAKFWRSKQAEDIRGVHHLWWGAEKMQLFRPFVCLCSLVV